MATKQTKNCVHWICRECNTRLEITNKFEYSLNPNGKGFMLYDLEERKNIECPCCKETKKEESTDPMAKFFEEFNFGTKLHVFEPNTMYKY